MICHCEFLRNMARVISPKETLKKPQLSVFDHSCYTLTCGRKQLYKTLPACPYLYYTSDHRAQAPSRRYFCTDIHLQVADYRTPCPDWCVMATGRQNGKGGTVLEYLWPENMESGITTTLLAPFPNKMLSALSEGKPPGSRPLSATTLCWSVIRIVKGRLP